MALPGQRPRTSPPPEQNREKTTPFPIDSVRRSDYREGRGLGRTVVELPIQRASADPTPVRPGDLCLPAKMVECLQDPVRKLGLELDTTPAEVDVGEGRVRFYRIRAASSYVALLYFDESRPD